MNFFSEIPNGQVIIYSKGIYRQVPMAVRQGKIYAKVGGGYARLLEGGGTSAPSIRWREIDPAVGTFKEDRGDVLHVADPAILRAAE